MRWHREAVANSSHPLNERVCVCVCVCVWLCVSAKQRKTHMPHQGETNWDIITYTLYLDRNYTLIYNKNEKWKWKVMLEKVQRHTNKNLSFNPHDFETVSELISYTQPELLNLHWSKVRAKNHKGPVTQDPKTHSPLVPGRFSECSRDTSRTLLN